MLKALFAEFSATNNENPFTIKDLSSRRLSRRAIDILTAFLSPDFGRVKNSSKLIARAAGKFHSAKSTDVLSIC